MQATVNLSYIEHISSVSMKYICDKSMHIQINMHSFFKEDDLPLINITQLKNKISNFPADIILYAGPI